VLLLLALLAVVMADLVLLAVALLEVARMQGPSIGLTVPPSTMAVGPVEGVG
jgi:hypothetical protein